MFEVGDRVRCVDDSWYSDCPHTCPIKAGMVYTISEINICRYGLRTDGSSAVGDVIVKLFEAPHPVEWGWYEAHRFRKLRDISQSLAEFRQMTINTPKELIRG